MARLSDKEKRELLEDAVSEERRRDFERLREGALARPLSPAELVAFLNWSQTFMTEDVRERPPIQGDVFKL